MSAHDALGLPERTFLTIEVIVEQDLKDDGVARPPHVIHMLSSNDDRVAGVLAGQLDRIAEDETSLRLLVVAPTDGAATFLSTLANRRPEPNAVLAPLTGSARDKHRLVRGGVTAVVATPTVLHRLLSESALKLADVAAVVIFDLDECLSSQRPALETLCAELPKESDRMVVTPSLSDDAETFLDGFAHKARRVPYPPSESIAEGAILYHVCDSTRKAEAIRAILEYLDPKHATIVASAEHHSAARSALTEIGYGIGDQMVELAPYPGAESSMAIWFCPPNSTEERDEVAKSAATTKIALVAPAEVPEFLRRCMGAARPVELPVGSIDLGEDDRLREQIRKASQQPGLHRELLALQPLFSELDPALVAAAVLRHSERRDREPRKAVAEARPATTRTYSSAPVRSAPPAPAGARPAPTGPMTRLFIGIGTRDGVGKGDLLGAIAGESGITSADIGRIELRMSHALVEVASEHAQKVIESMAGKTIRGRRVAMREDAHDGSEERPGRGSDRPQRSFDRDRPARSGGDRERSPRGERPQRRGASGGGFDRDRKSGGGRGFAGGRPRREGLDGPRGFREDRPARGPRVIRESDEWGARGDRLKHARRPRREGSE